MATVASIIDGTGTIGAAIGPLLTGLINPGRGGKDWTWVFVMLAASELLSAMVNKDLHIVCLFIFMLGFVLFCVGFFYFVFILFRFLVWCSHLFLVFMFILFGVFLSCLICFIFVVVFVPLFVANVVVVGEVFCSISCLKCTYLLKSITM